MAGWFHAPGKYEALTSAQAALDLAILGVKEAIELAVSAGAPPSGEHKEWLTKAAAWNVDMPPERQRYWLNEFKRLGVDLAPPAKKAAPVQPKTDDKGGSK